MSRKRLAWTVSLALFVVSVTGAVLHLRQSAPPPSAGAPEARGASPAAIPTLADEAIPPLSDGFSDLPLVFEVNNGQTEPSVLYLARGGEVTLFLGSREFTFILCGTSERDKEYPCETVGMRLVGGNPYPQVLGLERLPGVSNYLIGNDPRAWQMNVPQFARVRYEDVYPGIDLVFYGSEGSLEFDFIVDAGANPDRIRIEYYGVERLAIDEGGDLIVSMGASTFRQRKPVVYQEPGGVWQGVDGAYELSSDHTVSFIVGSYDDSHALVLDPVLVYSTYLGKLGTDEGNGIAVDDQGNTYVVGETHSFGYPTVNAFQPYMGGGQDSFVSKLGPGGHTLLFSTFLGGSDTETAYGVALDDEANIYIVGDTSSEDFPTELAIQKTRLGGRDVFMVKMNPSGSAILNGTYLGGSSYDYGRAIALDSEGYVLLTGFTRSSNFPTVSPLYGTFHGTHGADEDGFVTKLATTLNFVFWSTYLGGSDDELPVAIAADSQGHVYVAGRTASSDFPTTNAEQGSAGNSLDAFVAQIHKMGWSSAYSTYLGASGADEAHGIVVDQAQNAYVAGETSSTDFPTESALQTNLIGGNDSFLAKYGGDGSLLYATYHGGGGSDRGRAVALDQRGGVYVAGYTDSTDFPVVNAMQTTNGGSNDLFVTRFAPGARAISYSTYLGGSDADVLNGMSIGPQGNAYIVGKSSSTDFPTVGAVQPRHGGNTFPDVVVAKLTAPLDFFIAATPAPRTVVSEDQTR